MAEAFEDMVKRYKFTPQTPIALELFQQTDHYSVRTVGLPNLGALGVCFGQVITAMSPSVGNINWAMVLWHELSHVFAIQLSKSRVPRWYTEGLSEYETLIARPEWRRENDVDIWQAMEEGRLPSVAELNYSFMKPNMQDIVVAYHLSSVTIEYIAQTYGFDKIVEGLKLFGKGLETPAVIEKITGLKVPEFDATFREYLKIRLKPYEGSFRLPTSGLDDVKKLEIEAAAAPKSAEAQARLALGHFYDGNAGASVAAADKALALDGKNLIGLYVKAEVALRQRKIDDAKKLYKQLIAAGGDGFDVRGKLGMIAKFEKDTPEAEKQFCAAKKLDPERSYPYMELAELYESDGKTDEALRELEGYVMIEQMQFGPIKKLIEGYKLEKNWAKVRTYGEMGVQINPFDAPLHLDLGIAYLETGKLDDAIFSLESSLIARPELRRPALAHIGLARAYHAKKQKRKARAELKRALVLEPANAEALALKKKL
jgi:tetratricopeptide (TPR) repeat protein